MDQIDKSILAYIEQYPAEQHKKMLALRNAILEVLPKATEKISYAMPTFWESKNIIHFAANKAHLGIYPGPTCIAHFAEEFKKKGLLYSKGAVQIPWAMELPMKLIQEMAIFSYQSTQK